MERRAPFAGLYGMNRMDFFWLAVVLVSVATVLGAQDLQAPAPAAPPGPAAGSSASFERLDTHPDGKLTRAEARADDELARRFTELDVDRSGKLDSGEFARFEIADEPTP